MKKCLFIIAFLLLTNLVYSKDLRTLVGGYTEQPVDLNDLNLRYSLTNAMNSLRSTNQLSNGIWIVDEVLSVSTQVVVGTNYKITVKLMDISQNPPATKYMEWVVFIQSWTNTTELTTAQEIPLNVGIASSKGIVGAGWSDSFVDLADPQIQQALSTSLSTLMSSNGPLAGNDWRVNNVWSIATQPVWGMNYEIIVQITCSAGLIRNMQWIVWIQPRTRIFQLLSYQDIVFGATLYTITYSGGVVTSFGGGR